MGRQSPETGELAYSPGSRVDARKDNQAPASLRGGQEAVAAVPGLSSSISRSSPPRTELGLFIHSGLQAPSLGSLPQHPPVARGGGGRPCPLAPSAKGQTGRWTHLSVFPSSTHFGIIGSESRPLALALVRPGVVPALVQALCPAPGVNVLGGSPAPRFPPGRAAGPQPFARNCAFTRRS